MKGMERGWIIRGGRYSRKETRSVRAGGSGGSRLAGQLERYCGVFARCTGVKVGGIKGERTARTG